MKKTILLLLISTVVSSIAFAATTQSVRGHVTDASGHSLPGATVIVDSGAQTSVTDQGGNFNLSLPAGPHRIEISYLGFVSESRDIDVANGPANLEVKMSLSPAVSETVTVTASRESGEVKALNQRKTATNIVDVLPQETISSLPNANVAEALARLPSVSVERDEGEPKYVQIRGLESRYTSVTINGIRIPSAESDVRQIKLDAFPSDSVQALELHKTVSADQEGDAIGGAVNFVTPLAADTGRLSALLEGGYTTLQGGRPRSRANATWSNRWGQDKDMGLIFGATYDYNGRAINDIEPVPNVVELPNGQTTNAFTETDYRDYQYERRRVGFNEGFDYKVSATNDLYLRGLFAEFHNYGSRWVRNAAAGNFITPTLTDDTGSFSSSVEWRTPNEQTYSLVGGGSQLFQSAVLDYEAAYSHARQRATNHTSASFDGPSAAFQVDSSNGNLPQLIPLNGVTGLDPATYTLSAFTIGNENTWTPSYTVAANLLLPHTQWDVKMGIKYRNDEKHNDVFTQYFNGDGSLLMSQVMSSFTDPGYYFDKYQQGPNADITKIVNFFHQTPGAFAEDVNKELLRNDPSNFTARENVGAAYAKTTGRLGNAVLDAGVRLEHTSDNYDAFIVTTGKDKKWASTTPVSDSHSYTNALPSVSVRYMLDRDTNLRAGYGWTIARPNYADLVPSIAINDRTNEVSAGNPNLKPTHGQNYDLMIEHFFSSVGVLSGGAFFKDLKDPIYAGATTTIVGGTYDGFTQIQPINGPHARIRGFEVAWQQQFGFLPGWFSGLGIDANYTHTTSKAEFDPSTGRTGTAPLQRTTPNAANFGLTYDKGPVTFRAAATYNSASIFSYNYTDGADGGLHGPNGDTYLYPHTQVDAQISYTLPQGVQVFFSGLNLTDEVFGFYNGDPHYNIQREFYNRTYSLGVKIIR